MQFLSNLFGGSDVVTAVLALGIVLVLIVAAVWVLKFVFRASDVVGRGRNRRLTVVDSMMLDPRRQVHIVRRDNVEHVILTGGPQDVVLETAIPVPVEKTTTRRPAPTIVPAHAIKPDNPFAETDEPEPGAKSAVERLREFTRPLGQRAGRSLRHTGLMRPVSMEVIPGFADKPGPAPADSAKSPVSEAKGQQPGEPAADFIRDSAKAGGTH